MLYPTELQARPYPDRGHPSEPPATVFPLACQDALDDAVNRLSSFDAAFTESL